MSNFNTRLIQSAQLRQEMKINPRLYQAMELLYMPLLDLQQHLKQELAENPFLEMQEADVQEEVELDEEGKEEAAEEEIDWEEILLDGFDVGGRRQQYEQKEYFEPAPVEVPDLQDHLLEQLHYLEIPERAIRMGEEIIGNVDDDGSLSCALEAVVEGVNLWLDEIREIARIRLDAIEDEAERRAEGVVFSELFRPYELPEAEVMLEVIHAHLKGETGIKEVVICVLDTPQFEAFQVRLAERKVAAMIPS